MRTALSTPRTWCRSPQWSNQPFQNSATTNGSSARREASSRRAASGLEPRVTR
nr:hypothetical protein [Nonomuraea sp. MG754425]